MFEKLQALVYCNIQYRLSLFIIVYCIAIMPHIKFNTRYNIIYHCLLHSTFVTYEVNLKLT